MQRAREQFEIYLTLFEPEALLPSFARDIRSLQAHRLVLRNLPCTDFVVAHLSGLLLAAVESHQRFRTLDCLRTLRNVLRSEPAHPLSSTTIDNLLELYRHYVFHPKEEIRWCVSTYIKDRELSDYQVSWLIDNNARSVHIVNRLLRYPRLHPLVVRWADTVYREDIMPDRKAEVIALLIDRSLPADMCNEPRETLCWAIYYSRLSASEKERLLLQVADLSCADSALEIALRLSFRAVIMQLANLAEHQHVAG
jgi:hypothetical protein